MADLRIPKATLLGGPPKLLLTMQVGSRVVRLTEGERVDVKSRKVGVRTLPYEAGLTSVSDISRLLGWFAGDLSPRSISCQVMLDFDIAAERARGSSPWEWDAEVAQLYAGQAWEDRRVLIRGKLNQPLFEDVGSIFSFSIKEDPGADTTPLLQALQRVGGDTFPRASADREVAYVVTPATRDENVEGCQYPLVLGYPGHGIPLDSATYSTFVPATPLLYVELTASTLDVSDHVLLLAGHHVDATTVRIFNVTTGVSSTAAVHHGVDKLGQPFAYVNPGTIPATGDELWAAWDPDAGGGGGMLDPYGPGPLRRADHLIRMVLSQCSLRVDHSQFSRLSALSAYQIDGFINDPSLVCFDWLRTNILPLLPCSVVTGPGGLYVAPWNANAGREHAVAKLEVGRNCERVTPVSASDNGEVVNKFTLSFAPNASKTNHTQIRTITGKPSGAEEASGTLLPNYWCRRSQATWKVRPTNVASNFIYDGATMELAGAWMARAKTFPTWAAGFHLSMEYDWLRPGDVVTVTDEGQHLDEQVAHVEAILPEGGGLTLGLKWWEPLSYPKQ